MTLVELFSSRPSQKNTFFLVLFSILLFIISFVVMNYFHALALDPVQNIFETQLSFSGSYMKWQYANMGSIEYYRLVAITDYAFMAAYGLLLFSLSLIIARRFSEDHLMRKLVIFTAIFGLIAASRSGFKNIRILMKILSSYSIFLKIK